MRSAWLFPCALALGLQLAQGLTLEEAQERAHRNHPGYKVLEADIASARGGKESAGAWSNPDLGVAPGVKRSVGGGSSQTRFHGELSIEQTFEFPGKRSLRVSLAENNLRIREIALEGFRQQLSIEVRRAYFQVLVSGQITALKKVQVESARLFLQSAQKRVESGYASDFELLKAESDLIAAMKESKEAQGEIRQAKLRLAMLMGTPSDTAFQAQGTLESVSFAPLSRDPVALALERNPAIRAQALQVEMATGNLKTAKLDAKPNLTVGPSVEYASDEQVYGLNLSLSLPVWNRGKGAILSASSDLKKSTAELEKVRQEITTSVEAARDHVQTSEEQLALYTPEFLERLKTLMARAEKVYGQNTTSLLIYLEAKRSYFESLADYYAALQERAESQLELESAIGILPVSESQTFEGK